jgi:hypothetical protein
VNLSDATPLNAAALQVRRFEFRKIDMAMKKQIAAPHFPDDRLVTKQAVAEALGISLRTVERLAAGRKLEPVRILGAVRFRWSDVARVIQAGL